MNWKQVDNSARRQPTTGSYSDWKQEVASDCGNVCVYCAILESRYGGIDNFHVEHYRPKSRFPQFKETIGNLYLACAICNRFKSDDWPAEPTQELNAPAYPDPSQWDFNGLFDVSADGIVEGKVVATKYVAEKLYLNRPQLIRERRFAQLRNQFAEERDQCNALMEHAPNHLAGLYRSLFRIVSNLASYSEQLHTTPVFTLDEVRKPKKKPARSSRRSRKSE